MKGVIGVDDDDVVDVGSDAVQVLDDLVADLNQPVWSSAASLGQTQPLEMARR